MRRLTLSALFAGMHRPHRAGQFRAPARRVALYLLLSAIPLGLLGCSPLRSSSSPSYPSGSPVMKTVLPNGVTVLIKENRSAPLVTADIWVRTGAADEIPELSGVSHFLEHMVFKGSERIGVGEYDHRIENLGGYLNAATSYDYTHYFVTVPSRHFASAFADLADVVVNASLDATELEKERQVILEEIRRKQDSPMGMLYEQVFRQTYQQGRYKRPVLGDPETVSALTQQQMLAYHRAQYRPEMLLVVIVGDVTEKEAIEQVERALGDLNRKPDPAFQPPDEPNEYAWGVRREYPKDVREAYMAIIFPSPGIGTGENPEIFAAELAAHILGGTRAGRLWREVRENRQLVSSVSLDYFSMREESLTVAVATLKPENIEATREAILKEIERFIAEGPTADELARARKTIQNQFLFSTETNSGQCSMLGYFYAVTGSEVFEQQYLERLNKVTRKDIQEWAGRYLRREQTNLLAVVPETTLPANAPAVAPAPAE
jgi:zinc protease